MPPAATSEPSTATPIVKVPGPAPDKAAGVDLEKDGQQYDLLDDCRMMLRFAVKEGFEPDEALRRDIATLDGVLIAAGLPTISEIPAKLAAVQVGNVAPLAQASGKI